VRVAKVAPRGDFNGTSCGGGGFGTSGFLVVAVIDDIFEESFSVTRSVGS
jgi:hypothetical protein